MTEAAHLVMSNSVGTLASVMEVIARSPKREVDSVRVEDLHHNGATRIAYVGILPGNLGYGPGGERDCAIGATLDQQRRAVGVDLRCTSRGVDGTPVKGQEASFRLLNSDAGTGAYWTGDFSDGDHTSSLGEDKISGDISTAAANINNLAVDLLAHLGIGGKGAELSVLEPSDIDRRVVEFAASDGILADVIRKAPIGA
jgi:hypothetical protein